MIQAYGHHARRSDTVPIPPPAIPSWVEALTVGEWYEIPSTDLKSVDPSPQSEGNAGPRDKTNGWNSFIVDPRTSRLYSVANGGHNGYAGNEVDYLDLNREDPLWIEALPTSSNADIPTGGGVAYYDDGRPCSRHTYYGIVFVEEDDRFMLFGGAWYNEGGLWTGTVDHYNIGANTMSTVGMHPDCNGTNFYPTPGPCAAIPGGDVISVAVQTATRWDHATNTFISMGHSGTLGWGIEDGAAYDTTRNRIIVVGGQESDSYYYDVTGNSGTGFTLAGANATDIFNQWHMGVEYVPAIDRILFRKGDSGGSQGGTVYQMDPDSWEVTQYSTTGGGSIPDESGAGPFKRFSHVPLLGGMIYYPVRDDSVARNAWFLKLYTP